MICWNKFSTRKSRYKL